MDMPIDIILYAIVALGLILALRHVLGTRHGDEQSRANPFLGQPLDKAVKLPAPAAIAAKDAPSGGNAPVLPRTASVADAAQSGLQAIAKADNSFDLARFVIGAQDAFVMIVEAFAAGNRAALREVLSEPVFHAFDGVITHREQMGDQASVEIHAVRRLEVLAATLEKRLASITMRFVADETLVLRDRDGQVKEGNPDRVSETIDIWSFTRDLAGKSPVWRVTATREEAAPVAPADATPPTAG